jgi:cell division protein ZapA
VTVEHVTIRVFGESYPIKTGEPASRIEELARYVDGRMREVAASGKVVVTSKIAVLAALHIADELFRLRDAATTGAGGDDLEPRLLALVATLERALSPPVGGAAG